MVPTDARVTYASVLRVREFRAVFVAELLSVAGDQVARLAVAALVYSRTGSALLASGTYACSYLSYLVAGPVLSTLADRYPRRGLMVACDLVRAGLIALLLLPGLPTAAVFAVLLAVAAVSPPFDGARGALMPDILDGDAYPVGNALQNSVFTFAQVLGFAAGGSLIAALGVRGALLVDAVSFLASASILQLWVQARSAPLPAAGQRSSLLADTRAGARFVAGRPDLRWLLVLACTGMAVTIPVEGLAIPIAASLHHGPTAAGILTASIPAGYVLGAYVLTRLPPQRRLRLLLPLLLLNTAPMLLSPLLSSVAALTALWCAVGAAGALQIVANAEYVVSVPPELRGRALGLASTVLMGTQGVVLVAAGALSDVLDPRVVVALVGATGLCVVPLLLRSTPDRVRFPQDPRAT